MRMDGRTDRQADRRKNMTKLTVAFSDFANAPKNEEVNVTGSGSFPCGKLYCSTSETSWCPFYPVLQHGGCHGMPRRIKTVYALSCRVH